MALIVFALSAIAHAAQQELIEKITPIGNRRIPGDTILSRIYTKPGDVYDKAALERDFASVWNTGYFEDVRFEREQGKKGWIINVYVKEKPTIRSIDYKGLSSASNSDVLERFKKDKVGLSVESQYDPTKVKKAEVVLKNILAEHGHQFATIRTELRPIPPAAVALTFVIKEGPKVKVGKIKFENNKNVKTRELRGAMKNLRPIGLPHSIFFENIFARTYDSSKLQEDTERVRDLYQSKGYFKALVGDPKTDLHDAPSGFFLNPVKKHNGKAIDIDIPIEEGDRYRLGSITFTNAKVTRPEALRTVFPMKDGDIFSTTQVRKGLDNLRKAYGELGYINFTPVPDTKIDEEKKMVNLVIDLDEGKQYSVRRIEFTGNTTTRDKVIRRELALEEGNVYNSRLWELSLQRLNQLQYFDTLKPEDSSDIKRNDKDATVDINLKVKEKGKNSIGLTGGVSGLAGSFVGINYETNNFLGAGETLRVEANVGSLQRTVLFSFTEPYLKDKPLQLGFSVFTSKYNFNQAQQTSIQLNQQLNLPQSVLDTLQNFSQSRTGFSTSLSYPLHRSFKRIGITYSFDTSSVTTFSTASNQLFTQIAFRNVSGPDALKGVLTSKLVPSFSYNTIFNPQTPHQGRSLFIAAEFSGLGGNVAAIRPIVEFKQFVPLGAQHTFGYHLQGSFITGYRGLDANPAERFFAGGDLDLRGFDTRTLSPYTFLPGAADVALQNPDGSTVPKDPTNPRAGPVTVHIPVNQIIIPGGDTNLTSNFEYRYHVAGPVTVAAFGDLGFDFISRSSQLRINVDQLTALNTATFGCPILSNGNCVGAVPLTFSPDLTTIAGTNFLPRVSTGLELQVILPIVNAPFRIYYAYNPLRLDSSVNSPSLITRSMFPAGGAGDFTYHQALQAFEPGYILREPRKTFRFTVATTF